MQLKSDISSTVNIMIHRIIYFSVHHKFIIGLLTLSLIVGGIWSLTKIPLDAVPDITNNQVQVITQAPNLSTQEMEQFVTYPVELAMSNLPGVIEIRSISRFGLSLVTIVFEDDMGTYLPRQLVTEKLREVRNEIPEGFGVPFIGPISTGLGEIYQYTLEVAPGFEGKYKPADLRALQDWSVRRQMAMVPGVVEINAFGGDVKQFEVSVQPERLKAMNISLSQILEAIQKNNENTGGAYIEKGPYVHYIRGEGMARSMADIEQILIAGSSQIPVRIKDIAEVRIGKAVRYGAATKDGKGEAVGGLIMMLKGANSNKVIAAVKLRMAEIQKTLPEGVHITPYLDRSTLISNTTDTVAKNLMEGALIVIFVLVFLLGNWRGGLIVASTIPLSLLFAFILMYVFDVWANLMSLGAIDFGIIIDGAVIIVEGTVYLMYEKIRNHPLLSQAERDELAIKSAQKMMRAAFFGQLIILIVFIPILALQGVEGKMFKPMALTFMFAMLGVMLLCLTYVPMMSALFLKVSTGNKKSMGDRWVQKVEDTYVPALQKALQSGGKIIISAAVLLIVSVVLFVNMGGEFAPKLDEGDLAFHIIQKPGTGLEQSIKTSTKIEKILLAEFPEIQQVVSRFGVNEVPTDPMPMEVADCFVILKPRSEWVSADNKEALIEKMKEAISVVPGLNFEFTQPIEMRFNELITGVREDIAVKLFGEDLDILASKAEEMGKIIATVDGVADLRVEATAGLPQINVKYHRHKIAQYGLTIAEVNSLIRTAFAGEKAGVIFEGEKRFDLVLRLNAHHRRSVEDIKNLYVFLPDGARIPLREIAEISQLPGPIQISRDNTHRRTYVGVNTRGRDIQSVATDIRQKLETQLTLPPGYYIRYGGAFENFERALDSLRVLVPIVLGLIFMLIYFALNSLKQTAMIFIVIPMAAIGGVFSLWIRDMPFSISAGVGFIVLFGVAVLNGLVLITGWNELKAEGHTDLNYRIATGARRRIRPILLTALTDVLGFLPMAISTTAGAEVQRPLATVVIGGMISATLLTLFVLPVMYKWMEQRNDLRNIALKPIAPLIICFLTVGGLIAQESKTLKTVDEALNLGLSRNGSLNVARKEIKRAEQQKKSAFNPGRTEALIQYGQFNSFENDLGIFLNQNFEFPTVYVKQRKLASEKSESSVLQLKSEENELKRNLKLSWYRLSLLREQYQLFLFRDSLYRQFQNAAKLRYETGAAGYLEKTNAETRVFESENALQILRTDMDIESRQLEILVNDTVPLYFDPPPLKEIELNIWIHSDDAPLPPLLALAQQQIEIAQAMREVAKSKILPQVSVGYFNLSLTGNPDKQGIPAPASERYSGLQAGLSLPLFFGAQRSELKTALLIKEMAEINASYYKNIVEGKYEQQKLEIVKLQKSVTYYRNKALPNANLIIENARKSFYSGAIGYIEYFQNLQQAMDIKMGYLTALSQYNSACIELEFITGK
jgi:cobalt-zinc-cadmium resistance protein CzcA